MKGSKYKFSGREDASENYQSMSLGNENVWENTLKQTLYANQAILW